MRGCDRIRAAKAHNQIGRLHEARIVRNGLEPIGNVVGAGEAASAPGTARAAVLSIERMRA